MAFYIVTDVACDLPKSYIDKQQNFYVCNSKQKQMRHVKQRKNMQQ